MKRIMKALKKTSKKTEPKPEQFKTQEEAHEAADEYTKSQPVYTIMNFFFGGPNTVKRIDSNVEGKPPYY